MTCLEKKNLYLKKYKGENNFKLKSALCKTELQIEN